MESSGKLNNSVLIISCSTNKNLEIIYNLIGTESCQATDVDSLKCYPWSIETKYYFADLHLIPLLEKNALSKKLAETVQAVVIYLDNTRCENLNEVKSWLPFIESFNPFVRLLLCENCDDDVENGMMHKEILDWCLSNDFECVDLSPSDDLDKEEEFQEDKGYKRVIEALHSHTWSDLVVKEDSKSKSKESHSSSTETASLNLESSSNLDFDEERWLFEEMGKEDPEGESFEAIFSRIISMKEKAASLKGDERKLYAEKVAVAFWKAIGGDEDEIAGLSDELEEK